MLDRRRAAQDDKADGGAKRDGADLSPCRGNRQDERGGDDGKRGALAVGRERAHHREHGLRHDGDGNDLEPVQPAAAERATESLDAIGEQHERNG